MGNIKSIKMKKQKALILIDLQNDYFEGGLYPLVGSLDAVLKAQKLIHNFRLNSLPVIYIRHISSRQDATFFLPDTIGAEIHSSVAPRTNEEGARIAGAVERSSVAPIKNEDIIIKHSPNSFYQTELNNLLQSKNITDVVICGMMTHMCVDATVRAAKDLGYKCTIIQDACATKALEFQDFKVEAEKVQAVFLAALTPFYATVKSTDEYIKSCLTL